MFLGFVCIKITLFPVKVRGGGQRLQGYTALSVKQFGTSSDILHCCSWLWSVCCQCLLHCLSVNNG